MLIDWIEYGGVEIANSDRTAKYAREFGLGWLNSCSDCETVGDTLINITGQTYGDIKDRDSTNPPNPYTYDDLLHSGPGGAEILYSDMRDVPGRNYGTPQRDKPAWYDEDDADTWGFLGFYPLEVRGGHDDTREAIIRQRVADGAAIGPMRHGSRTMYVRGLLIGLDDNSVQAGMSWLKGVTRPSPRCDTLDDCARPTARMLSACPVLCDDAPNCLDFCAVPYIREFFDVVIDQGPTVIQQVPVKDGAAWEVDFFMTAALPWAYGDAVQVWPPLTSTPLVSRQYTEPSPALLPLDCHVDPDCPDVPVFPGYPAVDMRCSPGPVLLWRQYTFSIPADKVPQWAVASPVLSVHTDVALHDLRVRWWNGATAGQGNLSNEQYVTWVPPNGTVTLDAAQQKAMLSCNGERRRAEHLVEAHHGGTSRWPVVTCGDAWTVTVEVPQDAQATLDVELALRTRDG